MFFILSKTIDFLTMPIVWLTALGIFGFFYPKTNISKKICGILGFGLFILGNPMLVNTVFRWWEVPPTPIKEVQHHQTGIVLSGITNVEKEPQDRIYYGKGAGRVMHAVRLYREGLINKIVISGAGGRVVSKPVCEADKLRKAFLMCGIPEQDLLVEKKSRNTYENALYTSRLLKKHYPGNKHLLITSSFHLPRATSCFRKQNLRVTPFSTDFYTKPHFATPDYWLIPSASDFRKWSILIHEWVGFLAYKVMGYC